MSTLAAALRTAAGRSPLLIASDFDGVLAPLVSDPDAALADSDSIPALRSLAAAADTHVALISGRTLADLRRLSGEPKDVMLLGSHGAETTNATLLSPSQETLRDTIAREMEDVGARFPGSHIEVKPAGVAFHYRNVDPDKQEAAATLVLSGPASRPRLRVMEGKKIVEVALLDHDKGTALQRLSRMVAANSVVFLGDDVTDEDAFAVLGPADVGVKVGPEPTRARYRVPSQADVAPVLAELAALRRDAALSR